MAHWESSLCTAYGLSAQTEITILNDGENTTYLATDGVRRLVIRRYRQGRFRRAEIEAELSWLEALRPLAPVIEVIRTLDGHRCLELEGHHYTAAPILSEPPAEGEHERLGRLMRALHDAADQIARERPADWAGWNRLTYTAEVLVADPCRRLLASAHVAPADRSRIHAIAEHLSEAMEALPTSFVHNDLHAGNVMQQEGRDLIIDFDESGFGPRALDFGVVRLHMHAKGHLAEQWPLFEAAYGRPVPLAEARLGTALRVFWMAGKILLRPDVVPDPQVRIPRYLRWIEAELAE